MNGQRVREMLRSLLEDRFQLAVHNETREQTVLLLKVAKGGKNDQLGRSLRPNPDRSTAEFQGTLFLTAMANNSGSSSCGREARFKRS